MTSPSTINVHGVRYIQAKEAEMNFWVAVFGIAAGVILGIILLRSYFQVTLAEQTYNERPNYEQQLMMEEAVPLGVPSSEDISV